MKQVYGVTEMSHGDFEPGVALVAESEGQAIDLARAVGEHWFDLGDTRVTVLQDVDLDRWAHEHRLGEQPPIGMLRPHGWRMDDEYECERCGMCACGDYRYEVCGYCSRCQDCADLDTADDWEGEYEPCQECGR